MIEIKFGLNVSKEWLEDPFNFELEEVFELFSKLKIDCLEAQLRNVEVFSRKGEVYEKGKKKFLDLANSYNFTYTIHAPYPYYAPTYLNLLHGTLHKKAIKILEECTKIADQINAKVIVIHPSHTLGFRSGEKKHVNRLIEKISKNISSVTDHLDKASADANIGLEAMAPKPKRIVIGDHPKDLIRIIERVNSKKVGITWDMCHTLKSMKAYNFSIKEFEEIAKYTYHVHHSDFSPLLNRCHCPQGYGDSERLMINLLKKFKYDNIVIAEISPRLFLYLDPMKKLESWIKEIINTTKNLFS